VEESAILKNLRQTLNTKRTTQTKTTQKTTQVNEAKEKHNSAHFSNIGVYVNVQSFTLASHWPDDGRAYLNMSATLNPKP